MVEKTINKFEVKDYGKQSRVSDKRFKFCKVNYIPRLFEIMRVTLFKYDLKLIPVPLPKLKDLLDTKIDPVRDTIRSGVYIKPFKKDNKEFLYLGMTMRKFRNRIKEPEADLRLKKPHTTSARLDQLQPVNVAFNESKIIIRFSNYQEAIIRESLEIISNKDIVCNDVLSYEINGVLPYEIYGILSYEICGIWEELIHSR